MRYIYRQQFCHECDIPEPVDGLEDLVLAAHRVVKEWDDGAREALEDALLHRQTAYATLLANTTNPAIEALRDILLHFEEQK